MVNAPPPTGWLRTTMITMWLHYAAKCHLNTCSVGWRPPVPKFERSLRKAQEHVINYFFFFIAEQVQQHVADLASAKWTRWLAALTADVQPRIQPLEDRGVDLFQQISGRLAHGARELPALCGKNRTTGSRARSTRQRIAGAKAALESREPGRARCHVHRTVGAMLGGTVRLYGSDGLPDDTIRIKLQRIRRQSFDR